MKMNLKMSSAKRCPFRLDANVSQVDECLSVSPSGQTKIIPLRHPNIRLQIDDTHCSKGCFGVIFIASKHSRLVLQFSDKDLKQWDLLFYERC